MKHELDGYTWASLQGPAKVVQACSEQQGWNSSHTFFNFLSDSRPVRKKLFKLLLDKALNLRRQACPHLVEDILYATPDVI